MAGTPVKLVHPDSAPQGEYVSFGKVGSWSGDIFPTASLINALEVRSYKKEIIMTYVNDAISALEPAVNFFFTLRSMGFRDEFPGLPEGGVWSKKFALWMIAGRSIRLGYNVLTIDVDTTIHQDVYAFLKSKEMLKAHMIFQNEGGMNVNSGIVYLQNVTANGPVSYIINSQMIQTLRYFENPEWMQDEFPDKRFVDALYALSWDQIQMSWHVQSVLRGAPYIKTEPEGRNRKYDLYPPNPSTTEKFVIRRVKPVPWNIEFQGTETQLFEVTAQFARVSIPRCDQNFNNSVEVLAYPYPDKPGSLTTKFIELLEKESGELWDDPYDRNNKISYPEETIGTPSGGTVFSTSHDYVAGKWWGFTPPVASFISHQVGFRGPKDMRKFFFKSLGLWHTAIDRVLYETTSGLSQKYGKRVHADSDNAKFVALAPLHGLNVTPEQWKTVTSNLLVIAHLSGRIPVIPPISCRSAFLGEGPSTSWFHGIPLNFGERGVIILDSILFPEENELCFAWHDIGGECLDKMLLPLDYEEYVQEKVFPGQKRSNLVTVQKSPNDLYATIGYDTLMSMLEPLESQKIVYLSEPVRLIGIPWSIIDSLVEEVIHCFSRLTGPADKNTFIHYFGVQ
ncbi:hypothetical protein PSENEW3n2_00003706 [Picochlorum sp. SENEW3]|nr:hypothetical protein PSENEW3n2_00003706 [Picochlorum sp. SENEW3]WPT18406.1 hypothetical protein PSENEW3_00003706 [Picochlorum sp. SENEW3]